MMDQKSLAAVFIHRVVTFELHAQHVFQSAPYLARTCDMSDTEHSPQPSPLMERPLPSPNAVRGSAQAQGKSTPAPAADVIGGSTPSSLSMAALAPTRPDHVPGEAVAPRTLPQSQNTSTSAPEQRRSPTQSTDQGAPDAGTLSVDTSANAAPIGQRARTCCPSASCAIPRCSASMAAHATITPLSVHSRGGGTTSFQ